VAVATFVLSLLNLVALRYIVLGRMGVWESLKAAWSALRTRFKDLLLMWLINWGLNVVASIVVAIPIVILTLAVAVPSVMSVRSGDWTNMIVLGVALLVAVIVISLIYTAIWGVFTSALWTVFFRRLTGMEPIAEQPTAPPSPAVAAYPPGPPVAPYPPEPEGPPVAQYPPAEPPAPTAPDERG
jgi:hypothetical protein